MTIWMPDLTDHPGPRYRAIAAAIADATARGELQPGQRLPTHRALADALAVTVGTVTRGYAEAERQGLVEARVGSGTYVSAGHRPASFRIPEAPDTEGTVHLDLNLPVPAERSAMLANTLRAIADDGAAIADALSYQPERGLEHQRRIIGGWLARFGTPLDPRLTILTLGAMHGVHTTLQALAGPGDTLASESLTYPGLIAAARALHLRHVGLPLDEHGLDPEAFEALCRRQRPRVLYLVPHQNNPTTACLPEARRRGILDIARRHDVLVIEDEVYPVAAGERPPTMLELAPEQVVHISGVSKVLAGGLRVGIVQAPERLHGRIADTLRSQCWMAPPLNAEIVCRWIESGEADALARFQREALRERHRLAAECLRGFEHRSQPYAFNVWLPLPEPWRAAEFAARCAEQGVRLNTAEPFVVGRHEAPQAVRLSISAPPSAAETRRGLGIVRELLDQGPRGVATF